MIFRPWACPRGSTAYALLESGLRLTSAKAAKPLGQAQGRKNHERLQHFNGERYQLGCSVIMPNHCHAVIRPFDGYELEDLIGPMKGITAKHINADFGGHGELWQQESHDRIIRDAEHLHRVIQYIGRNPASSKLPSDQWQRWIDPAWETAGWKFET